jgi:hypothetical protein
MHAFRQCIVPAGVNCDGADHDRRVFEKSEETHAIQCSRFLVPAAGQGMDSGLISRKDLSGYDPTHGRVLLTCDLPDLRLGLDLPDIQCGYQLVSGALMAGG